MRKIHSVVRRTLMSFRICYDWTRTEVTSLTQQLSRSRNVDKRNANLDRSCTCFFDATNSMRRLNHVADRTRKNALQKTSPTTEQQTCHAKKHLVS